MVVCTAAFVLLYAVAVRTGPGQEFDNWAFGVAQRRLGVGPLQEWWPWLARVGLPFALGAVVAVLGLISMPRHPWRAASAALVVGMSTLLSRTLQDGLPRPAMGQDLWYVGNTFPSTHVAATVALLVAVWLLWATRPGWLVRVLSAAAVLVAVGNVVGHAHRPSDALGSVLLVAVVTRVVQLAGGRPESGYPDVATRERSARGRGRTTGKDGWA